MNHLEPVFSNNDRQGIYKQLSKKWNAFLNIILAQYRKQYIQGTMVNYEELDTSFLELSQDDTCIQSTTQKTSKQIMLMEGLEWYKYKIFDRKSKKTVVTNIKKTYGYKAFQKKTNALGYDAELVFFQEPTEKISFFIINLVEKKAQSSRGENVHGK